MADPPSPWMGYIVGFGALAAVLLLNQWIFSRRWKSYPTAAEYLAAHPESRKAGDIVCYRCGNRPARMGVRGRGSLYRCTWCEDELYRVDRDL
jgi:hypothetical protein